MFAYTHTYIHIKKKIQIRKEKNLELQTQKPFMAFTKKTLLIEVTNDISGVSSYKTKDTNMSPMSIKRIEKNVLGFQTKYTLHKKWNNIKYNHKNIINKEACIQENA